MSGHLFCTHPVWIIICLNENFFALSGIAMHPILHVDFESCQPDADSSVIKGKSGHIYTNN